jgi:AcrR family transcriptional regulator
MVTNSVKRKRGRPQAFRPEDALDRAVEMFWKDGYEGVDVGRIAEAVHVSKPALYRAFGDKSTLLVKAVERYVERFGGPMLAAFMSEPDIHKAVLGFCEATVANATGDTGLGCMMAAAVLGQSERVADIRKYAASGLTMSADILAERFEQEIRAGNLPETPSAHARGRAFIDLMQGLLLRAKTGIGREELLADARSYVPLLLR